MEYCIPKLQTTVLTGGHMFLPGRPLLLSLCIVGGLIAGTCPATADSSLNSEGAVVRDVLQLLWNKGYITHTEYDTLLHRLESTHDTSPPVPSSQPQRPDHTTTAAPPDNHGKEPITQ